MLYSPLKVAAVFVLVGIALFGASLNDPFHFDDVLILKDSNVTNSGRLFHFLNPFHLRQLTFLSFYLNYLVGGGDPSGFHIVNIALHIANSVLLYSVLSSVLEGWTALAASAIFLVHPIQTEPVLYIYQRSILLACFFSLLALMAFQKRHPWIGVMLFVFAFESKESALAVPLALALLHVHRLRRTLLAGVLTLEMGALALLAYRNEATVGFGAARQISPLQYLEAQFRVVYTYLRLLVWPYPQSLEYEFPASPGLWLLIAQVAGLLALVGFGMWAWRQDRWRVFGVSILAFLVLLAPTSSIIPSADAAFEHRLYLPMLAFAVFLSSVLTRLPWQKLVTTAVLALFAIVTVQRGTVWSSDVKLWEDATAKAPHKARAWFNLGGALLATDPEKAKAAFGRALELQPVYPEIYYDLGMIEQANNSFLTAMAYYQRAVEQDETFWPAWNNMGNAMVGLGERDRAIACFERTLSLNPDYWPAQYNIAVVHAQNGRFDEAIQRLRIVLDWSPDFKDAQYLLATSLSRAGHSAEAEEEWKKIGGSAGPSPPPATILAPKR